MHVPPASVAPLPRQRAFLAALLAALGPAAALTVHPAALPPALHHHPKAADEEEQQVRESNERACCCRALAGKQASEGRQAGAGG